MTPPWLAAHNAEGGMPAPAQWYTQHSSKTGGHAEYHTYAAKCLRPQFCELLAKRRSELLSNVIWQRKYSVALCVAVPFGGLLDL